MQFGTFRKQIESGHLSLKKAIFHNWKRPSFACKSHANCTPVARQSHASRTPASFWPIMAGIQSKTIMSRGANLKHYSVKAAIVWISEELKNSFDLNGISTLCSPFPNCIMQLGKSGTSNCIFYTIKIICLLHSVFLYCKHTVIEFDRGPFIALIQREVSMFQIGMNAQGIHVKIQEYVLTKFPIIIVHVWMASQGRIVKSVRDILVVGR